MNTRTITAMFDSADAASRARQRLLDLGLSSGDVQVIRQDASDERAAADHKGMWESIKDFFTGDGDDRATYEEGMRRGGQVLTARVQDEDVDDVLAVLNDSDAVDLDQRAQEWRSAGWTGTAATGTADFEPMARAEEALPAIEEERLRVGRREANRGGARARSYVVEESVEVSRDDEELAGDEDVPGDSLVPGAVSDDRARNTRSDRPNQ